MTSVSSLAFPGSRTLAGWWRQLSPHHPMAFAVGYLFVHKVEAPVIRSKLEKVDRLAVHVLRALDLAAGPAPSPPDALAVLTGRLHLDRQVLRQVVRDLESEGLLDISGRGQLTPRGRQALQQGHYFMEAAERRLFQFMERNTPAGERAHPPHFLNLRHGTGSRWQVNARHPFEVGWLRRCLEQPEEWKQTYGFPLDVLRIPEPAPETRAEPAWKEIIVDEPEHMLAAFVLAPGVETPRLLAFAAQQEGWRLQATDPILVLERGWQELFPELAGPPVEPLTQAWQHWAQTRGLTAADLLACAASGMGQRLHIEASPAVADRLRAGKGDWLLVGDGYLRTALTVEIVSRAQA